MAEPLLPTTVVGSYPQPDWLIDRALLTKGVPRVRVREIWRVPEQSSSRRRTTRRSSRSATWSAPASTSSPTARSAARATRTASRPRSTASTSTIPRRSRTARAGRSRCRASSAPIRRRGPVEVRDVEFLRAQHRSARKITLPGPVHDGAAGEERVLRDDEEMALDFAAAVNEEVRDLQAAGADVVQLDEPWLRDATRRRPSAYGVKAINRALEGVTGRRSCTCASATRRS